MDTTEDLEIEKFKQITSEEELEQFLSFLGLRDELLRVLLSKGVDSIEKLLNFEKLTWGKNSSVERKKNLISKNLCIVFERINFYYNPENKIHYEDDRLQAEEKPSFLEIIRGIFYELDGIILTKEMLINGFKMKNKPNNCLPVQFKNLTPEKIYASFLQNKRVGCLEGLDGFKNLKHLYLDNNKIQKLEHLDFPNLNILMLANNFIRKIENMETLPKLTTLNLEMNLITKLENLKENVYLEILNLNKQVLIKYQRFEIVPETLCPDNIIHTLLMEGCNFYDPICLSFFPNMKKLKLNHNKILDLALVLSGLGTMHNLNYLYLANNPFIESNKNYRNLIVIRCENLAELDDKTITENEKQFVKSFYARKFAPSGKISSMSPIINKENNNNNNFGLKKHNTLKSIKSINLNVGINRINLDEERKRKTPSATYINMRK